jgi:GT2 family glycosyltransferase
MGNRVFVVLLNWNGWQDTIECLESLEAMNHPGLRLVVVDNGSTDDSWERLSAWRAGGGPGGRDLALIQSGDNLGFAGGSNIGMKYALEAGADVVWLLNNDTVVEPQSLSRMLSVLEARPDVQVASPQIRYFHDRSRIWNCGGFLTWYGTYRYLYAGAATADAPSSGTERITFVSGCAPLIRASLLREVGLLTTRFFFGTEDIEFSQRLQEAGKSIVCVHDSVIFHKVGSSVRKKAAKPSAGMAYHYYLSIFINMKGRFSRPAWHAWRLGYLLYILPMVMLRHGIPGRELAPLARALLRDSSRLDAVDRATFERATRGEFASPG